MFNYSSLLLFQLLLAVLVHRSATFTSPFFLLVRSSVCLIFFTSHIAFLFSLSNIYMYIYIYFQFINFFLPCFFFPNEKPSRVSQRPYVLILAHHHGYDPLLTRGLFWIINPGRPYKANCFMVKECQICLGHTVAETMPDVSFLECRAHRFFSLLR